MTKHDFKVKRAHADLMAWLQRWPGDWRMHAVAVIQSIPSGWIATYGSIATEVNKRLRGENPITARQIAWLRRRLYGWVRGGDQKIRDMGLPLHRIAKQHDEGADADSAETSKECVKLRRAEGSLPRPRWWPG